MRKLVVKYLIIKCIFALLLFVHVTPASNLTHVEQISWSTKILPNEFIVQFTAYLDKNSRKEILNSALDNFKTSEWEIIERKNPVAKLPSDFDVIILSDNILTAALRALSLHKSIKSVTQHKQVTRKLNFYLPARESDAEKFSKRKLLRAVPKQITSLLKADALWRMGITGKGVKVAVFDTGLSKSHPHFKKIKERTNWTNEKLLDDRVSHGTFVAGLIASSKECLGFAPDAELYIFRVFTNNQVSYTSWFLDAFNYAIHKEINILNLSIGGPDFLDKPFVEKVQELTANRVIMVSAIGNDGPLYGTLNNPGDQSDVIGVGGINFEDNIAKFSSRGMTTWELPHGYGRLKPDIVTYGSQVKGSHIKGGCRSLSGTSVASPIVSGAVALLMSGASDKFRLMNPASIKQALIEGATRLNENNMFEQGHGKLNILRSLDFLNSYEPQISLSPSYLDTTEDYMWPYSTQSLFFTSSPLIVNVTILNGVAVTGQIREPPTWHPYDNYNGHFLNVSLKFSEILWPWSGWMSVHVVATEAADKFEGIAQGHITLKVYSIVKDDVTKEEKTVKSEIQFPLKVRIIPKPPRHKRILWDQFHSLRYPSGYLPRDNLKIKSDHLDWRGDHIHTNFKDMYTHLRNGGYYVEVLGEPFTCFNASNYGTLLIVDPEEEYFTEEIRKLKDDVLYKELSVIIFADWYNTTVMKKIKFFDENTRQWWIPDTGGSNIPAINELLRDFNIELSDTVLEGYFSMLDHRMYYASGTSLSQFPQTNNSIIIERELFDQGKEILLSANSDASKRKQSYPILGLLQTDQSFVKINPATPNPPNTFKHEDLLQEDDLKNPEHVLRVKNRILLDNENEIDDYEPQQAQSEQEPETDLLNLIKLPSNTAAATKTEKPYKSGRLAVYGDSNCLDSTHIDKACFWLLDSLLEFTMTSHLTSLLKNMNRSGKLKFATDTRPVTRLTDNNLHKYSSVLRKNSKFNEKRPIGECPVLAWAPKNSINITSTVIMHQKDAKYDDLESNANLLRKLESEKTNFIIDDSDEEVVNWRNKPNSLTGDESSSRTNATYIFILLVICLLIASWLKRNKGLPLRRVFGYFVRNRFINLH
ncbi:membrane-bound transcription factor site-1 protease [Culicoides brevitarsis]|uniref:membrane-bound transcription factor site-1 protease n=1 Tax=Culicoides brevitarsis TaxID=469753 RepID=UPI00307B7195